MPTRSESNVSYKEAGAALNVLQKDSLCKGWRGKILILLSFCPKIFSNFPLTSL